MMRFLTSWFGGNSIGQRHAPARRRRQRDLTIGTLEERLALSTSPLGTDAPVLPPNSTGSGTVVILPDRPVHGYKWRPRPWWPYSGGGTGTVASLSPKVVTLQGPTVEHSTNAALLVGGADGRTVSIGHGHVVVMPPLGPAPIE
jgi:hypothetical protein